MLDRLDLVPQFGERPPPQLAQHAGVGPLATGGAGRELAFDELAIGGKSREGVFGDSGADRISPGKRLRGKRRVRTRVAFGQVAERVGRGGEERFGNPGGQRYAERVAVAGRVFDGNVACLARYPHQQRAAGANELPGPGGDVLAGGSGRRAPLR